MQELDRIPSHSLKGALEALLLVSTDAVPATEFARELGVAPSEAADALEKANGMRTSLTLKLWRALR